MCVNYTAVYLAIEPSSQHFNATPSYYTRTYLELASLTAEALDSVPRDRLAVVVGVWLFKLVYVSKSPVLHTSTTTGVDVLCEDPIIPIIPLLAIPCAEYYSFISEDTSNRADLAGAI